MFSVNSVGIMLLSVKFYIYLCFNNFILYIFLEKSKQIGIALHATNLRKKSACFFSWFWSIKARNLLTPKAPTSIHDVYFFGDWLWLGMDLNGLQWLQLHKWKPTVYWEVAPAAHLMTSMKRQEMGLIQLLCHPDYHLLSQNFPFGRNLSRTLVV